jgi:hypothetical protein
MYMQIINSRHICIMDIHNSGPQRVRESRLVLHHVMHMDDSNKLLCYHHQQPPKMRCFCDMQHFHLHDLDYSTPEPPEKLMDVLHFRKNQKIYKQKSNMYVACNIGFWRQQCFEKCSHKWSAQCFIIAAACLGFERS